MYTNLIHHSLRVALHKGTQALLLTSMLALVCAYIYFANGAVRTVALLEKTKDTHQTLAVEVSEMEAKRMALEHSLTSSKAIELGLVEVGSTRFIMAHAQNALSLKDN